MFEEFWQKTKKALGEQANLYSPEEHDFKGACEAVWNDGRQLLLMSIVLKIKAERDKALKEYNEQKPSAPGPQAVVNALGKLIVTLSEMKV